MTQRIETIDSLHQHLQWAIELEHATIPPYLCALYSLDPARNPDAVELVGSVFVEEMIHLSLAANLLNAVGGEPRLDVPEMLPGYPRELPHGSIELSLLPFGPDALQMFLRLEKPEAPGSPAESDHYETIAQFYDAIEDGLRYLSETLGEDKVFSGDPARQVTAGPFHHTAGTLQPVTDLASALAALEEIVEQGEGTSRGEVWDGDHDIFHPDRDEVAHYYRFEELKLGRRYRRGDTPQSGPTGEPVTFDLAGVSPMQANPRRSDNAQIRAAQEQFDNTYCTLLFLLEQSFTGEPALIRDAVKAMFGLKAEALKLMQLSEDDHTTAGPTFRYIDPQQRS
ncbi:ferritin-like protein [Kribbella sp. VKM Ac-2571]|uniref:ferritin-like domain-containing protein n=1 Tax=Kribbella sp. VKM Ac-2571 TaxID=2512222 RepID=UPI00105D51D7|nr:ferritin-like protein [Kribbella sp. VKM Ac-2571]TDO58920.1 ferritin-like protein [Kribbella sp. VKM Ac-2571]